LTNQKKGQGKGKRVDDIKETEIPGMGGGNKGWGISRQRQLFNPWSQRKRYIGTAKDLPVGTWVGVEMKRNDERKKLEENFWSKENQICEKGKGGSY